MAAGGNFGREPSTAGIPRRCPVGVSLAISKDLGGVRWGVFEVSESVFWRRVHFLRASPRMSKDHIAK
jgi:hypothetical protein